MGDWDPLEQSVTIDLVECERFEMDVANVAPTGVIGTGPWPKGPPEFSVVEIADHLVDKVAAANVPLAVDGEYRLTRATGESAAGVAERVDAEMGIDSFEGLEQW